MAEHILTLARQLARISRCQIQSNVRPMIEIIHALPEELNKLEAEDFAADAQTEFVLVRNRIKAVSTKTSWSFNDFPGIVETADRLVAALEKYEGRYKPMLRSLSFVKDAALRKILERDLNELKQRVYPAKAWKSAVVLAGSILEGILYDQLATDPSVRSKALSCSKAPRDRKGNVRDLVAGEWNLASMIEVATDIGILTKERQKSIDQVLRDYRNFVHPMKELRAGHSLDEPEAMMAVGALDGICKHLS